MKKAILLVGGIILVLAITLSLIHFKNPGEDEPELTQRSLPPHTLWTISGEQVQIDERFPGRDYLLLFVSEGSETSLTQLRELTRLVDTLPEKLTVLVIHLGRMNLQFPDWVRPELQILIDPEARLAQAMLIRTVPTLLILNRNGLEVQFAETLVAAEELLNWFTRLEESVKFAPSP